MEYQVCNKKTAISIADIIMTCNCSVHLILISGSKKVCRFAIGGIYADGDDGQCGGGAAQLLCASVGSYTAEYRDDTDN